MNISYYDSIIYCNVSQALANSPEVVKQAVVVEENLVMGHFFILHDTESFKSSPSKSDI